MIAIGWYEGKMGLAGPKRIGLPLIILFASAMSASAVDLISCSHHKNTSPDAPKEYRTKTGKGRTPSGKYSTGVHFWQMDSGCKLYGSVVPGRIDHDTGCG